MATSNNSGRITFTVDGVEDLCSALQQVSSVRFDAVRADAAKNIYNRANQGPPWTPVDTGELRQSLRIETGAGKAIVGYTKDYAPHVEYGHRTRSGGYVAGQHFLQRNVNEEGKAFKNKLLDNLKGLL